MEARSIVHLRRPDMPRPANLANTARPERTARPHPHLQPRPGPLAGAAILALLTLVGVVRYSARSLAQVPPAKVDVTTYHNDNARTGLNAAETLLKPSNVNSAGFGKIFSHAVDGYVYAEPLIANNVTISGHGVQNGVHDVVFVATQHDTVYAFDSNSADGANANPLWSVSLIPPGGSTVPWGDVGTQDIVPEIGISGTPVIDTVSQTIYVLAKTKENGGYVQRLHALSLGTGAEKFGGPVVISASVSGTGDGSQNGVVPFDALREHNRPGLLLLNGVVYIGWASHGDNGPYHGWVIGYNASTLAQTATYNTTPNGGLGGIWMAGAGLATDGTSIFLETGNGTFTADTGGRDYGDSFVRLSVPSLSLADSFTPFNQDALNQVDEDLGAGGMLILPDAVGSVAHPHLLVGCGKEGKVYLVDRTAMGGFHANDDSQIVQSIANAVGGTWSMPAFYKNTLYYNGAGDVLKAFPISNAQISAPSSTSANGIGFPGATPVVSSNGVTDGIVWLLQTDAYGSSGPAVLHAYDAGNVAVELYNSGQAGSRDTLTGAVKFAVPTVANGKVYVGSQYAISVFGLGAFAASPLIRPNGGDFQRSELVSISDTTPGAQIRYTLDGTDPTTSSTLYTGPFTLNDSANVRARAFATGLIPSAPAQAQFTIGSPGAGDGLSATYFSAIDLTGSTFQRVDPTVDFDWNGGSPAPGIGASNWSARWTGYVQPRYSGRYTFSTLTDDGVRVWVNNQLIIDDWTFHGATVDTGTITLFAHKLVPIRMEFFQGGGGSLAHLSWSALGGPTTIIPQSQLYSTDVATPQIVPNGGPFRTSVLVGITEATAGAAVYYTLDGTTPTAGSRKYAGPFTLGSSAVLKAKAIKPAAGESAVATAVFTKSSTAAAIAINCGGGEASPFHADNYFDSGGSNTVTDAIDRRLVSPAAPQAVYQSERWGSGFEYRFTGLKPGTPHTVRLHFAELVWSAAGKRSFNVSINGAQVLSGFDIYAAAGAKLTAVARQFSAVAGQDGTVHVRFTAVTDYASCSGIEVVPVGASRGRNK
jgi:hypothetical protein